MEEENGFIFNNCKELGNQLENWFSDFPINLMIQEKREKFERNLKKFQRLRWEENWNNIALPSLNEILGIHRSNQN